MATTSPPKQQRRTIQFQASNPFPFPTNQWSWIQIRGLLNANPALFTIRQTSVSILQYAEELYGVLPQGKEELRRLRDNAKQLHKQAHGGNIQARNTLRPYRLAIRSLIWSCRMKLGTLFTTPNPNQWSKKGYGLYLDIQKNLGKTKRVFFLTLTFRTQQNFQDAREKLRGFTKNVLNREGFWSLAVVAYHPPQESNRVARLHAHLLVWPKDERGAYHHTKARQKVEAAMKKGRYGIGLETMRLVSGLEDFLRTAAYVAFNYDSTVRLDRNFANPIPKAGRILSTPQEVHPGKRWERCKCVSFVTPSTVAWRKAVNEYAQLHGYSMTGNHQWIWRRRRSIRMLLQKEKWRVATVTGLDGRAYRVVPYGGMTPEDEWYLMTNDERGSFIVDEKCVELLGKLDGLPGSLPLNDRLDPVSGQRVYVY